MMLHLCLSVLICNNALRFMAFTEKVAKASGPENPAKVITVARQRRKRLIVGLGAIYEK